MKLKTRKCTACGKENVYGVKKCISCQCVLEKRKSCPRCARWNTMDSKQCSHCGHSFLYEKHLLLKNFFFSIILVGVLFLFLLLNKKSVVLNIQLFLKMGALLLVVGIIISIFTYGEKEKITYSAEEEIVKKNLSIFKKFSILILGIGFVILLGVLLYFILKEFL